MFKPKTVLEIPTEMPRPHCLRSGNMLEDVGLFPEGTYRKMNRVVFVANIKMFLSGTLSFLIYGKFDSRTVNYSDHCKPLPKRL